MLDNSHNYDYNRDKNIFSINRLIMFNLINGGKTVMVKKTKKCISVAFALIMMLSVFCVAPVSASAVDNQQAASSLSSNGFEYDVIN